MVWVVIIGHLVIIKIAFYAKNKQIMAILNMTYLLIQRIFKKIVCNGKDIDLSFRMVWHDLFLRGKEEICRFEHVKKMLSQQNRCCFSIFDFLYFLFPSSKYISYHFPEKNLCPLHWYQFYWNIFMSKDMTSYSKWPFFAYFLHKMQFSWEPVVRFWQPIPLFSSSN